LAGPDSSGRISSATCCRWGKGYEIVNYDKLTYAGNLANLEGFAERPDYAFVKGDICNPAAVEGAMRGCDALVHFAAEHVRGPNGRQAAMRGSMILRTACICGQGNKLFAYRLGELTPNGVSYHFWSLQTISRRLTKELVLLPTDQTGD
jgi:nucleoside-diphosphate-sugar epimerase